MADARRDTYQLSTHPADAAPQRAHLLVTQQDGSGAVLAGVIGDIVGKVAADLSVTRLGRLPPGLPAPSPCSPLRLLHSCMLLTKHTPLQHGVCNAGPVECDCGAWDVGQTFSWGTGRGGGGWS